MAEAATATKSKTEYTPVVMTDGRTVQFAGKKKMDKNIVIDESKVMTEGDVIQFQAGAVGVRIDFLNGETRTYLPPLSLYAQFLGHGTSQKYGDETATTADKPLTVEDMIIATDDLDSTIQAGNWGRARSAGGGGVSGAAIVVRAIMEATGKDLEFVKAYIQRKLEADKDLTRKALYDSFRVVGTQTGDIIKRLEDEKRSKEAKVDADAELAAMQAGTV